MGCALHNPCLFYMDVGKLFFFHSFGVTTYNIIVVSCWPMFPVTTPWFGCGVNCLPRVTLRLPTSRYYRRYAAYVFSLLCFFI